MLPARAASMTALALGALGAAVLLPACTGEGKCRGPGCADSGSATGDSAGGDSGDSGDSASGDSGDSASGDSASGDSGAASAAFTWAFDDAVGSVIAAPDTTGHGYDGVVEGAVGAVPGARPGRVAARFGDDGGGVVLDAAAASLATDLAAGEPLRVQVALRTTHHGAGDGVVLARGAADGDGWSLTIRGGSPVFALRAGGAGEEVAAERLVADGRWHVLTAGRDADATLVLAVDGVEVARGAAVPGVVAPAGPLHLGAFAGDVDELRVDHAELLLPDAVPEREVVPVYAKGEVPAGGSPARYDTVRIPALLQAPGGALLAFAEGRVDNACDFGDVDAVVKRSLDGGRTWSAAQVVVDAGPDRVGNPVPVADARTGRVYLLTTTYALDPDTCGGGGDDCVCETTGERPVIEVRASDDDGATWGAPVDVTDAVYRSAWSGMTLGPGHGFQRADGTLVIPAAHRESGTGARGGHLLVSADGVTWAIGPEETGSDVNVNESSAAELPDGSIVVTTRYQLGSSSVTWDEREAGLRGQATILPDLSWATDPAYVRRPDLRGPVVFGSILQLAAGDLGLAPLTVLSWPAGEHGSNYGQRHDLRLWTSEDAAVTWREGARVQGPWAAYSDLAPLGLPGAGDAGLGVLVESAAVSGTDITYYDRIDLLRLARPPLDDLALAAWTFEGADPALAAGPAGLRLAGTLHPTAGEHASTALSFTGAGPLCADEDDARGWIDFGVRDAFEVEATFRTTAHTDGGSSGSGALVTRTSVGSLPAWWLRVQDGRLRFLVGTCDADTVNCGIVPGECDGLDDCEEGDVWSTAAVADGAWHHVVARRDPIAGTLSLVVDGGAPDVATFTVHGIVKNEEPVCLGAFADGARAFVGDLDDATIRIADRAP